MQRTPALLLRPMNRDRDLLFDAKRLFQGYHVGASLPGSLTNIVRESGKPYVVDPQTFLFTLRPQRLFDRKTNRVRNSLVTMANRYGPPFSEALGVRALTPMDFANAAVASATVDAVISYQRVKFSGQMGLAFEATFDKYNLWGRDDSGVPAPQVLVPPYFYVKGPNDPWLATNIALARHALEVRRPGEPVYPVLLFSTKILADAEAVKAVASAYLAEPFDGMFLWPNDFVEEAQPLGQLQGLARLLSMLADGGRRVSKLYGGYLSALLASRGLRGFSCGLGYGASKNAFAYGGGGGAPAQRFYIPRLHRSVRFEEAERMIEASPSLRCTCVVCADVYGRRPGNFAQMRNEGRCELHFLHARRTELQQLGDASLNDLTKQLERTASEFDRSALVRAGFMRDWASVLAA